MCVRQCSQNEKSGDTRLSRVKDQDRVLYDANVGQHSQRACSNIGEVAEDEDLICVYASVLKMTILVIQCCDFTSDISTSQADLPASAAT